MSNSSKKTPNRAPSISADYYYLDPEHTDPVRVKRERAKAQELKKSGWWKSILAKGVCHYCEKKFKPTELTMDHVVPIARGGSSVRGNVVPACRKCNASKKLDTPVDQIFKQLEAEKAAKEKEEEE